VTSFSILHIPQRHALTRSDTQAGEQQIAKLQGYPSWKGARLTLKQAANTLFSNHMCPVVPKVRRSYTIIHGINFERLKRNMDKPETTFSPVDLGRQPASVDGDVGINAPHMHPFGKNEISSQKI